MSGFRWRRGHTLLQLAAAMAILALLVLAAMPAYRESRIRGYLAEARQVAREWAHLARAWYLEKGSWQGASDQAIGWVNPNSRFWIYGPHRYGPEGFPQEAWFVATLRPGLASGAALAQGQAPDYLFVLRPSGEIAECGTLTHRDCQGRNLAGGPPPQNPPGNLRVLAKTHNSISVAWDDTPTETSYTVRWRKRSSGSWDGQAPLAQDTTSYTISGLLPETEYLIQVEATGPGGTAAAGPISVTTDGAAPPAATNLQVTATTDTSISLSWQDNAQNETGYRVEHRQQGASSWVRGPNLPANTTSHTVTGLQPSTTYELQVVAFNSWGETPSQTVQGTTQGPPSTPTGFQATGTTNVSISLSWNDVQGEDRYLLEYRQQGTGSWTAVQLAANTTQLTVSGLHQATTYEFRLSASNQWGSSAPATLQASTAGASEAVSRFWPHLAESSSYYTVSWSAVPGASSYTVQHSTSPGGSLTTGCLDTTSTSCRASLTSSSSSGTAYVRVGARSASSGNITWSPMMRTYYGSWPNYEAFSGVGSITFYFYPHFYTSSGADATATKKVRYRKQGTQQWTEVSVSTSSTSYTLSGLGPNECYEFQALVESTPQQYGTIVSTGWRPATPVVACSDVAPVASLWPHLAESSYYYGVSWSAVPGASNYTVQHSTSLGGSLTTGCLDTTSTSCRASLTSSSSSGTAYVRVGARSANSGRITWSPMMRTYYGSWPNYEAFSGVGSITFYFYPHFYTSSGADATATKKVRYRKQGTQQWTEVSVSTSSTSYTLSGLGPNECYEFQALVESTPQQYGTIVSTGWRPATPVVACSDVAPVASLWPHLAESSYYYGVSWSAVPGASNYTVQHSTSLGGSLTTGCLDTTSTSCRASLTSSSSSGTAYVRVGARSASSGNITWSPMMRTYYGSWPNYEAFSGVGSITFYFYPHFYTSSGADATATKKVRYRKQGTQQWTEVSVSTSSTSYTLSGLGPNECYEFQALVGSTPQQYGTIVSTGWRPATPVVACSDVAPVASLWPHLAESSYYYGVSWSAVPGASNYTVQHSTSLGGSLTTGCLDTTSTSCRASLTSSSSSGTAYVRVGARSANSGRITWSPMMRTYYGSWPNYEAFSGVGSITFYFYPHFYTSSGADATATKKVRYRKQGTQQWTEVSVSTSSTSYTLSGLGPNECYEFQALVESTPQQYGTIVSTGWRPATPVVACSR
jgi:phage-related protein